MLEIRYHPDTNKEIIHAATTYEDDCEGLGFRFLDDLDEAVNDIQRYPEAWPVIEEDIRRHQFQHFSHSFIYRKLPDHIRILAIMHQHQEPGYWKSRK